MQYPGKGVGQAEDKLLIAGFSVLSTSSHELAEKLLLRVNEKRQTLLFFVNTNFVVKCSSFIGNTNCDSMILVNDGVGMDMAAKIFYNTKFKENLNGTDFLPKLFSTSKNRLRIFLIGGRPSVVRLAAEYIEKRFNHEIVGLCDGYEGLLQDDLVHNINAASPDVVLVAMGNPLQEKWIMCHKDQLSPSLFIGVGALFDFWSGKIARAPLIIRKCRLEWLYRLLNDPKRLLKRYTVDIFSFFKLCWPRNQDL